MILGMFKKSKTGFLKFICFISLTLIVTYITFLILSLFFENNSLIKNTKQSVECAIVCISLLFTLYSIVILIGEISDNEHCSMKEIKQGCKEIAKIINTYSPDKIIMVKGNSEKLFDEYIEPYLKGIKQDQIIRYDYVYKQFALNPNVVASKHKISTNKFILYSNIEEIPSDPSRYIIFDDVVKTGDTIKSIMRDLNDRNKVADINILTVGFIVDTYGFANDSIPGYYFKRAKIDDNYKFKWR